MCLYYMYMADDISGLRIDKTGKQEKRVNKKRPVFIVIIIIVFICGVLIYRYGFTFFPVKVQVVTVSKVYPSQSYAVLNASGYIVPQRKASVASKITGKIIALNVTEGMRVKKGDIIARLENDDILAQRRQAQANLELARANLASAEAEFIDAKNDFEREKALYEKEFTTKASFDSKEARFKKAEAALRSAKANISAYQAILENIEVNLEYTFIKAPFNGMILTKNADIGDIVTPLGAAANAKAAVVTMADMDSLEVEADISESNLTKIWVNQPCEITLDAIPDKRFSGMVSLIVPTADRSKATIMVRVKFIEKDVRILPEMSAKVIFLSKPLDTNEKDAKTFIDKRAIIEKKGNKIVYVVNGERVREQKVIIKNHMAGMAEVIEGVGAGEKVVINPPKKLKENTKIKILEK